MSHWNLLEKQLRCWTPRAPSPNLKARLFGERRSPESAAKPSRATVRATTSSERDSRAAAWHWLAPAMAVFVLGLIVFGNHSGALPQFEAASSPRLLATAALTQPELSAYCASVRHSDN